MTNSSVDKPTETSNSSTHIEGGIRGHCIECGKPITETYFNGKWQLNYHNHQKSYKGDSSVDWLSKKTCQEVAGVLERMYFDVRKGSSDLRPFEKQIKGIFKSELQRREKEARSKAFDDLRKLSQPTGFERNGETVF